jgi:hypothetical protein
VSALPPYITKSPSGNNSQPCSPKSGRAIRSAATVPVSPIGWSSRSFFQVLIFDLGLREERRRRMFGDYPAPQAGPQAGRVDRSRSDRRLAKNGA